MLNHLDVWRGTFALVDKRFDVFRCRGHDSDVRSCLISLAVGWESMPMSNCNGLDGICGRNRFDGALPSLEVSASVT